MSESPMAYEEPDKGVLLFSGLNDAYIGCVESCGKAPVACYSKILTIRALQDNYHLSESEARDRYEYEYLRSNYGEETPVFLDDEKLSDVS